MFVAAWRGPLGSGHAWGAYTVLLHHTVDLMPRARDAGVDLVFVLIIAVMLAFTRRVRA